VQRYYVPKENWQTTSVRLSSKDAHHVQRVMRQQVGDKLICNHPDGKAAICMIEEIDGKAIYVKVKEWLEEDAELPIHVTIAQGLPKGSKLELILQKGTELGATSFQLFEADRSISKWDQKKTSNRLNRYDKIVKEASEQCHRTHKPSVYAPKSLHAMVEEFNLYDYVLFAYEEEAKQTTASSHSFAKVLNNVQTDAKVLAIVGPEGGFSAQEVKLLIDSGATPIRLGKRILRTETASMYILASISYHFEELRCK